MKRPLLISIIFMNLVLSSGCAIWTHGWTEKSPTTVSKLSPDQERELLAQAEEKWNRRHFLPDLLLSMDAYKKLVTTNPKYYHGLARLSRGYHLLADCHYIDPSEQDKREKTWEEGIRWGEKALATNENFKAIVTQPEGTMEKGLHTLTRKEISALYWTASNIGKWVSSKGIMAAFKYKIQLELMIDRVGKLDPSFFYGAVDRYWGAFYSLIPGHNANHLQKSKHHFQESLKVENYYLGTHLLFASAYAVKMEDKELFKKELEFIINTNVDEVPALKPENILEKRKAVILLKKLEEIF